MPIEYWINYDSFQAPNCLMDAEPWQVEKLILFSINTWMKESESKISFKYMGSSSHTRSTWSGADNQILFTCEEVGGSGKLGAWYPVGSNKCGDGTVALSDDHYFTPSWTHGWYADDASSVLIHEIGHVLGMDHNSDLCAVMRNDVGNMHLVWGEVKAMMNAYGARSQNAYVYLRPGYSTSWSLWTSLGQTVQSPALEYNPETNLCMAYSDVASGSIHQLKTATFYPYSTHSTGSYTNNGVAMAYSQEWDKYLLVHIGHILWDVDRQMYWQLSGDCANWSSWYEIPEYHTFRARTVAKPALAYNPDENSFYMVAAYHDHQCGFWTEYEDRNTLLLWRLKYNYYSWYWDIKGLVIDGIIAPNLGVGPMSLVCAQDYGHDNCLLTWVDAVDFEVTTAELIVTGTTSAELQNVRKEAFTSSFGVGEGVFAIGSAIGQMFHVGVAFNFITKNYLYNLSKISQSYYYGYYSFLDEEVWSTPGEAFNPVTQYQYKAFSSGALDVP